MGSAAFMAIISGTGAGARRTGWCPLMIRRPRVRRSALARQDSSSV
ncbi:MAG TPA: hypothetical protein VFY14_03295 [Streptomyces sp.]|nr:hypothetical protein [Streptomyces sp.]